MDLSGDPPLSDHDLDGVNAVMDASDTLKDIAKAEKKKKKKRKKKKESTGEGRILVYKDGNLTLFQRCQVYACLCRH